MTFASWLNIAIANGRSAVVFRAWKAVSLLSGAMAGAWTIVGCSAGTAGASPPYSDTTWTGDTSPGARSWIVLQCETPNADGTRMQVFIGFCDSSGALAGFGTKAAGVWIAVSPTGDWDQAAGYFGASLADWRNGSILSITGNTAACVMTMILTKGDAPTTRPGGFYFLQRVAAGVNNAIAARMLTPEVGAPVASSRCMVSACNTWAAANEVHNSLRHLIAKTSLDGWDAGYLGTYSSSPVETAVVAQDAESGAYVESVCPAYDAVLGKSRGYDEVPLRVAAADGDLNGPTLTADRWSWGGYSWPREPGRDGSMV